MESQCKCAEQNKILVEMLKSLQKTIGYKLSDVDINDPNFHYYHYLYNDIDESKLKLLELFDSNTF